MTNFKNINHNYTSYRNPGFWLINSQCIFRVFSYLGLISFITAAEAFACGFNFFSLCAVVFAKTYFTFLPSRASNRQIHSEYFRCKRDNISDVNVKQ